MKIISLVTFFFKLLSKFTARTSQSILMESKDRERGRERERQENFDCILFWKQNTTVCCIENVEIGKV